MSNEKDPNEVLGEGLRGILLGKGQYGYLCEPSIGEKCFPSIPVDPKVLEAKTVRVEVWIFTPEEGGRANPVIGNTFTAVGRYVKKKDEWWSMRIYFDQENPPTGRWIPARMQCLIEEATKAKPFIIHEGRKKVLEGRPL